MSIRLEKFGPITAWKPDKHCYLGDMLDANGGCDSAVTRVSGKSSVNT